MNKQDHSVSVYAYVGDAVLEVYIRERLAASGVSDTGKLSALAQKLSEDFFRAHRSYLINLKYVTRIGRKAVTLCLRRRKQAFT